MTDRPHVLCDVPETCALLTPVSVRLYNSLGEMQRLVKEHLPIIGNPDLQGAYNEAMRVLRDARILANGETPDILKILEEVIPGRVATGLRATGPNSVPLDGSKPRSR